MKACERYIDLMMRSIDRDTSPQEEAELQTHLAQCEACRALYETYQALDAGLAATEEEPPETLTGAVMNSIRAEKQQRSPKHLLSRFRFTAVAAVAAVLVLVFARFGGNVTSVTGNTANTARSADTSVPQVAAEFRSGNDVPAAQEPALAEAPKPEIEEAVEEAETEECLPEDAETPMEPAEGGARSVTSGDGDSGAYDLSQQVEALHALGLSGNVFLISGMTGETLQELLPELTATELDSGEIAYEASTDAVAVAAAAGELNIIAADDSDESGSDRCYLILTD